MAFNGSGTYVLPGAALADGQTISATEHNTLRNDMATALTTCVTRDGQSPATANLPMGGFKHTGLGSGTARTESVNLGQVQDGKLNWVIGGGTADAITATYSPSITSLEDGQILFVRATAANATTTPTFSPNGLTARTIVKKGGQALVSGDVFGAGHELALRYDLSNTRWELLNPGSYAGLGSNTFTGTQTFGAGSTFIFEGTTADDFQITLSPGEPTADRIITLPDKTGTVAVTSDLLTIPSGDIVCSTTNDSAAAGDLGEYIESVVLAASAVSLTTSVAANVTSISLTAGDWDVFGYVSLNVGATTSFTVEACGSNTTSATLGSDITLHRHAAFVPQSNYSFSIPTRRISIASTTTVYLVAFATFTVSTCGAYGRISARRVR